jgi:pimeloyl-ACP methyl ester carboxylesterase
MNESAHRTGTIASGDVELFYRLFGTPGATPLLILHGTNYFDSYDWIGVAHAIASDREVVAFDHRGFGNSSRSPSKDYSLDAMLGDIINVSAHFGWERPVVMGHSMSGRLSIFFAANFPDHLSRLIVVDSALGNGNPGGYHVSIDNELVVFESVEAAMASLVDRPSPPRFALDRDRAELALDKVASGYSLKRDPDYRNTQSQAEGAPLPRLRDLDIWEELRKIRCPVTIVRGLKSDRYNPEHFAWIAENCPDFVVETVDARHDVAYEVPDELVAVVRRHLD